MFRYPAISLLAIGQTLAWASIMSPALHWLPARVGGDAKKAIILITLVSGFASTISYPVIYTLSESLGWRGAVRILAAIVIFVVAPVLWTGVQKLEVSHAECSKVIEKVEQSRVFLKLPAFWSLVFGFAFLAMAHGAVSQPKWPSWRRLLLGRCRSQADWQ